MENQVKCPRYVDYVRECSFHIDTTSRDFNTTIRFCVSENYINCPFFRYLDKPKAYCPHFVDCDLCKYFKNKDFDGFISLAERWCLTSDFINCARYVRGLNGPVPDNLYPDGTELK
ncbi:MAG: hypothetical protein PHP69_04800 [Candidatus Omnitrophica bacterium]|nr:hypothetical protein [Candidatus Omnitrophota bacterium]MDD5080402.1 hypothetical protein [Candidatus Omnitrophota bacterium]MDD5440712.1 hypothetical protein [Candidatus Omnitrophota bacterium]